MESYVRHCRGCLGGFEERFDSASSSDGKLDGKCESDIGGQTVTIFSGIRSWKVQSTSSLLNVVKDFGNCLC